MAEQFGSRIRDAGDVSPAISASSPGTFQEELPRVATSRNFTPRGLLFPSFGEAHKNITASLAGSTASKCSSLSDTENRNDNLQNIPLQDLNATSSASALSGSMNNIDNDEYRVTSTRTLQGRSLTDYDARKGCLPGASASRADADPSALGAFATRVSTNALSAPSVALATTGYLSQCPSASTVDAIYEDDHSVAPRHEDSSTCNASPQIDRENRGNIIRDYSAVRRSEFFGREGATGRCGFRDREDSVNTIGLGQQAYSQPSSSAACMNAAGPRLFEAFNTPGAAPTMSLPPSPQGRRFQQDVPLRRLRNIPQTDEEQPSFTTISHSQSLLDGAFEDDDAESRLS